MEIKQALKDQFRASLRMLAQCVERCPDDLWTQGEYPRYYWRIAFHAIFFTHVGIAQDEASYVPWPDRPGKHEAMFLDPAHIEPYELPDGAELFTKEETLAYISHVDAILDESIDRLDLDTDESGYRWYPKMSKMSNVLMNLRHIEGHVGQLSELLMARGVDIDWVS